MGGHRIRIVLALVVIPLVAGFSGVLGLWVGANTGEDAEQGAWSLLGVRDGGRTLIVRGSSHGACDETKVTVDESQLDRVVIDSRVLTSRGGGGVCILMQMGGERFALRLSRPIVGRAVVGKRRRLELRYDPGDAFEPVDDDGRQRWTGRSFAVPDHPPPNVVGLRFRDARHALCNAGFEARRPRGNVRIGMVVAQRAPIRQPPPGRWRDPTCTNGMLPAVDLDVWAR